MLIHCPNCDTAYNINKEDLAQSGGQVVCCRCDEVFEAEIYKVPDDPELLDDTMLDSAITRGVGADWQPDLSLFENIDKKKKNEIVNSDSIIELTPEHTLSPEEENNNKSALELASEIIEDISFNGSLENPSDLPLSFPSVDELELDNPEVIESDNFTNPDIDDLAGLLGDEPKEKEPSLDNLTTPPHPISEFKEFEPNNFNFATTESEDNMTSDLSHPNKDKVTDDINHLLEEFSDVDADSIASEFAAEKETEENNELSELLDGLSQEVVKEETSFIDESSELSDLLDSMSGQGLLEEDSALKEEAKQDNILEQDSDLSQLDDDDDYDVIDDGIIKAVDKIDNPDLRTEPLSYFSDSMMVEDVAFANTEEKGFPWFKLLASCFLFCSLLMQIAWFERYQIIKSPAGRNFAETLCEKLSCQLPQKTDLSKIALIKRYFESDSYIPHALQLKLIIANNAEFEQPYPIIKVDLSNHHNEIIASRYFKPEEYLEDANNKDFMPINTPQTLLFQFEDTKRKSSGFNITFY